MITTKVMPLESMRMESVTFAPLALLLQMLSEHSIHFFSPFNCFFFLQKSKETQKTKVIQLVPTEFSASQPLVIPSQTRTVIQMFQKAIQG